ncbi:hypothetical protein MIR68_008084 [Amoeboaphelidium protococcarum]|nr:hypothetical protein MIR68_008084 [Amoeboaphelidium protococcarum]
MATSIELKDGCSNTALNEQKNVKVVNRKEFKSLIIFSTMLALCSGYIGAVQIAGLFETTTVHMSGNVIRTGLLLAEGDFMEALKLSFVWIAYIFGSFLSAIIVSGTTSFSLSPAYGFALLLECALLLAAFGAQTLVGPRQSEQYSQMIWVPEYLAAVACGLQNALCTSYSSATIRTTHMTGTSTDIGLALGQEVRIRLVLPLVQRLRNKPFNLRQDFPQERSLMWKLKIFIPLYIGYLLGAVIGGISYYLLDIHSLLPPAIFIGTVAVIYLTQICVVRGQCSQFAQTVLVSLGYNTEKNGQMQSSATELFAIERTEVDQSHQQQIGLEQT